MPLGHRCSFLWFLDRPRLAEGTADFRELFDQRTETRRDVSGKSTRLEPGRFLNVHVLPDFDHERMHSRVDVPVRGGHDAAAERAIEDCRESMLAADLLQIGALVERRMKLIKPNANFGASIALVKFVRKWCRREAVCVDDLSIRRLSGITP